MENFWANQVTRNETRSTLYVALHKESSTQPQGYVLCWDASKEFVKDRVVNWAKQYPLSELKVIEVKPPF